MEHSPVAKHEDDNDHDQNEDATADTNYNPLPGLGGRNRWWRGFSSGWYLAKHPLYSSDGPVSDSYLDLNFPILDNFNQHQNRDSRRGYVATRILDVEGHPYVTSVLFGIRRQEMYLACVVEWGTDSTPASTYVID